MRVPLALLALTFLPLGLAEPSPTRPAAAADAAPDAALAAWRAPSPEPPPPTPPADTIFEGSVSFVTLHDRVADLRRFDVEAAGRGLPRIEVGGEVVPGDDPAAGNTAGGAIEAARRLFHGRSFDEVEKLAKAGKIDATTSDIVAEGRRRMIAEALKRVTAEYAAQGVELIIGALDSGNKNSGTASDIDQTLFAMTPDGRPSDVNPSDIIRRFDAAFRALYGFTPAHMGIESMNGADFYPDWRARHHSTEGFVEEARRVVLEKRKNPEAYRSEGELKVQAEGRGYDALRSYFEELKRLDDELASRRARSTLADPNADPEVRRLVGEIEEHQRLAPWSQFEMRPDESGELRPVEVRDRDPRDQIMQNEPEKVRRFAFDGAYDNWVMWQAHPGNRTKYLLRSVADGIGLLTQVRFDGEGAGRYDLDRPWVAKPVEYEKLYADRSLRGEEMRSRFLRDVYGNLAGRETGLSLEKVERALAVASRARLRHKGEPGFVAMNELDIYREYLPQGERFAGWTDQARLDWAKRAWEVDSREIMLENLLRTVRAPGDITQGWGDPDEWRAIRERFPAADHPHLTPSRLKSAAWLQLYHGFLDLMTDEHARQILEGLRQGRRPLDGISGIRRSESRPRDMVDRLVNELGRVQGPEAEEARVHLEQVLIDAAVTRQKLDPNLGQARLSTAVYQVVRQELRQRIDDTRTSIAEMREQFERVRVKLRNGDYTREVVANRVLEGTAHQLARATASVLGAMGFRGEVHVRQTIEHLADIERRSLVPEIQIRIDDQAWSAKQALTNFASAGNVDSFTQVILAYQEEGSSAAVRAALVELLMNVPGVAKSKALWDGVTTGEWAAAWMAGTSVLIPIAGQGYVAVSIVTTTARIMGNVVLEPLFDDTRDMAYQGFLGAENEFVRDQRGQRVSVLYPVPITVIPHEVEGQGGESITDHVLAEYPEGEAIRMLVERSGDRDTGLDLEGIPLDSVYAFGRREGLWGGGEEWERLSTRASDWLNQPRLNFEAKRASLWHHYGDAVDAWLAGRDLEDTDVLLAFHTRAAAADTLSGFFAPIVADWAYGRGPFEAVVGGENELLLPPVAEERLEFFNAIARRMAGDYLRSYRIVHLQPVRAEGGTLADASLEAGLARSVVGAFRAKLEEEATTLAVAVDEARKAVDVPPALAEAVHRMRLERTLGDGVGAARVHVRPRVLGPAAADGDDAADAVAEAPPSAAEDAPTDRIEFYISVVADPEKHPPDYRHEIEWILGEGPDSSRVELAAVVRVRDRNGAQVGDSVFVELGTVVGEAAEPDLVALEPKVEVRAAEADADGTAGPDGPDPDPGPDAERGGTEEGRGGPDVGRELADFLLYDDLTVYFQPARDTTATVWRWRIVRVGDGAGTDTARVASGLYVPGGGEFDTTDRSEEGAPAPFAAELGSLWHEDGPGPGTYVLQTCLPSAQAGALGQTSGWAGCLTPHIDVVTGEAGPLRPWQDEGRFQVGAATLTLQGFVAERGVAAWAEDRGPWLSLENVGSGAAAGADLVYTWDECVHPDEPDVLTAPCDRHGEGWSARRRTDRARFALSLPEELNLQAPVLGELKASLTPSGDPRLERSAVLTPLVPGTEAARELAGTAPYDATGLVYPVRADPPSGPFDPPTLAGDGRERAYLLRNEFRRDPGDPDRPMGIWARDASARWFLPIPIRAGGLTLHAFAVYGTRPGSYAGPVPEAPGSIPPLAQADDPGEDDPGAAGGEGDQPGMDVPGGEAGPGPGGEADIDGGEDVDGAQPGDEGVDEEQPGDEGVDGGEPDERDDPEDSDDSDDIVEPGDDVEPDVPDEPHPILADYTGWKAADAKAALEEAGYAVELRVAEEASSEAEAFTVARQEPAPGTRPGPGTSVTLLIHGEYAPLALLPDVRGWPAADARRDLETLGFEVVVRLGEPALTRAGSNTVERQEPVGGGSIEAGSRVTLWVRDEFVPPDDVPPAPAVVTDTADVVPPARDSAGVVPARADTAGVGPVQTDTVRVVPPAPDSAAVVPPEPAGCPTRASGAPEFEIGPGFLVQWVWHPELGVYCGYMRSGGGLNQYMLEPEGNGYFLRTHDRPGQPSRRVMRFERGETPDPSTGWLQAGEVLRIEPDGSLRSISWWFARPPTPSR